MLFRSDVSYSFGISGNSEANGWALLNTTSTGVLAAGVGFDFRVWINVPEDTPAGGSYSISVATDDDSASATLGIASDARSAGVSAADGSFLLNPGTSATTVVTVTNTGNVTLTDMTVTDPLVTVIGGPIASLAVGASDGTTFSGTYLSTNRQIFLDRMNGRRQR